MSEFIISYICIYRTEFINLMHIYKHKYKLIKLMNLYKYHNSDNLLIKLIMLNKFI